MVILQQEAGIPTYSMARLTAGAATAAYETDVWLIKGVDDEPQADTAEAIAARLRILLNDGALSISGATQLYLRRESEVAFEENKSGRKYHHVGALYRLLYQSP